MIFTRTKWKFDWIPNKEIENNNNNKRKIFNYHLLSSSNIMIDVVDDSSSSTRLSGDRTGQGDVLT